MWAVQDRPGLVVLVIELENALANMQANTHSTVLWSPYREPLSKFLNKYSVEVSSALPLWQGVVTRVVAMQSQASVSFMHHGLGRVFIDQACLHGRPEH